MAKVERITLRIPKEIHEWLRQKSFETRKSINSLIVEILEKEKEGGKDDS